MALPEFVLPVGCQRDRCRPARKLVTAEGEVFDNNVYLTRIFIQHLLVTIRLFSLGETAMLSYSLSMGMVLIVLFWVSEYTKISPAERI